MFFFPTIGPIGFIVSCVIFYLLVKHSKDDENDDLQSNN